MNEYWNNIFIAAIRARMDREQRTAEDIIQEYTKLTAVEKADILTAIAAQ